MTKPRLRLLKPGDVPRLPEPPVNYEDVSAVLRWVVTAIHHLDYAIDDLKGERAAREVRGDVWATQARWLANTVATLVAGGALVVLGQVVGFL